MNRRYDEIMEHIEVTPEMRRRILNRIEQADLSKDAPKKVILLPYMKRLAALAACLAIVLVGALTLPSLIQELDDWESPGVLGPGNGIVQADSVEELAERVGFEVTELDRLPFQAEEVIYTAYWQDLAEIVYNGEGQTATYRKGVGTEDVSGDYNIYETETKIAVKGMDVTLKGNGGAYTLAIWADKEYAYSLSLSEGMTEGDWETLLA